MLRSKTSLPVQKAIRGTCSRKPPCYRPALETLEERCLLSANMVVQWNQIALQASVNDYSTALAPGYQIGPTRLSRAMAIVQAAVYDAVDSIDPQYTPYLVQVAAPTGASMDAAVAQAAHDTLVAMFPNQKPFFDSELAASLQGIPMMSAVEGVAVGSEVASYILTARANDGSAKDAVGQPVNYTFGQLPGQWRADPLHPNQVPLTPDWGSVTPFGVESATQFLPPPPTLTSLAYATAYEEVKILGSADSTVRTPDQTQIAFFWGYDAQPTVCAPIRFYNQIAEVIAAQEGNSEVADARFFALTNIAMADGAITCWDAKYLYDLWRPITAIRENDPGTGPTGLGSGNPYLVGQGDPNWMPVGAPAHNGGGNFTPPFPSYTSGHATIGAALFKVMEDFYGTDNVQFTISTDEFNTITGMALSPRTYYSFSQASGENALSRIYLGIHYNFDAVEGIRSGDAIADYDFTHLMLPLNGPTPRTLPSMDPNGQILLAITHENDQNTLGYKIGLALDLLASATSGFDGHQDAGVGGTGIHGFGSAFSLFSAPASSSVLASDSDSLIPSTLESPSANVSQHSGEFQAGPLEFNPDDLTLGPAGGKSALALSGSVHRTQHTGSTLLSASDMLFGGQLGDLLGESALWWF
jgi:PAP2 superfamily